MALCSRATLLAVAAAVLLLREIPGVSAGRRSLLAASEFCCNAVACGQFMHEGKPSSKCCESPLCSSKTGKDPAKSAVGTVATPPNAGATTTSKPNSLPPRVEAPMPPLNKVYIRNGCKSPVDFAVMWPLAGKGFTGEGHGWWRLQPDERVHVVTTDQNYVDFYWRTDRGEDNRGDNCFTVAGAKGKEKVCGVERKVGPTPEGEYTFSSGCSSGRK